MPEANTKEFTAYFQEQDRFSHKIGYKILSVSPGKSEYEIEIDDSFFNPVKIVHGGALFSAMDSSAGAAMAAWIRSSNLKYKFMATATAEIKYRKSVTKGKVRIKSEITEQKRSIVKLTSQAFDEEESLVAELFSTWVVKLGN
ncbi:PaaI family thioesterase [Leptospira borgpetersenii]|uniref:PaaI family thioesterase n=1 Tax=Leptospira borgpetersenii TaxID=174 RepID=UPI000774C105|nr:PaaI family thioesterase [Leptospira borgpetersenii]MBE8362942.1 PaaI family thioesterase [Leptospira borgpetersenii serovar Balcanica]MBE8368519.1 PaaI family thioesterase [Leptospira borgpetersenii serovar Balcanica]MBE8400853.1 PaaI family thioesterase [Leptospira borgpetersenii serovar Tarassovi]MBE8403985.1 PaaI family thioesterase [Leptospira borgpetersenii serovar Tarassovi]MBE8406993.1 PaaI family thioesterase [Leptospira borgpetersenii serovar Tarassovi]